MRIQPLIAACALALASLPAAAQTLKPGLWEIQTKVGGVDMGAMMAQMRKDMAGMPPEQRKQMEAMMAQQGVGAGAGNAIRMCMTKEMVERNDVVPMEEGCKITKNQRSGNTTQLAYTCTKPPSSGEGQFTMAGPEAYSSRMVVKTQAGGKTETTTMESSGRWVKADCGNVRPPAAPKK